ncbi:MAG: hypothetical protein IRZ04_18075 [Rhodospirillales bacterium]|nr:hypothetical protein [Rhodospirillales bacterium]
MRASALFAAITCGLFIAAGTAWHAARADAASPMLHLGKEGAYLIFSQNDHVLAAEPPSFVVDNHNGLTNLRWSRWGSAHAVAHGVFSYDDCKPDCAQGHQHTAPATVIATAPSGCGAGTYVYTRVSFSAPVAGYTEATSLLFYGGKPSSCAGAVGPAQSSSGRGNGSSWSGANAMTGPDVGVCIGIDSGDVLDSDGYGDSFGNYFWDPLGMKTQVQGHALGGISAFSNHISIYFWNSAAQAKRVYAAAKKKGIHPLRQYGNAVMVGYQDLSPLQRHVVDRCLVPGG